MSPRTLPGARTIRALCLLLAASTPLLLAACGGGDSTPTPPPTPGTLAVSLSTGSASVVAGAQTTATVNITRGGSFTGAVTLTAEGAPAGVTATFAQAALAAGATSTTLTVQVGGAVAAGTYPLTIRAAGTGVTAASTAFSLTVTATPVPDFTVTAAPAALSVVAGAQGTSQLTLARSGGFTGAVQLALEGAPTGVTGTFAPNPATAAASTLTLATAASTAPGTYTLTVRGTGTGVAARTATVTLTVTAAPTLAITSAISTVTVTQAQASAAIPLVIARGGGATGDVALTLVGAPAGVTGAFTPNPATGASSQLVITVAASAAPGTYALTVRGTAGGTVGTLPLSLTVTAASAGDFAMSVVPSTLVVTQGQTGLSTVNIARSGGFTGAVNLTVTGLPAGVTGTFTPASATGTQSQLGLAVGAGVAPGSYTLTVRGNATLLAERTVALTLTVQASGGGTGNVTWQFCDTDRFPVWFGYQDGASGAWTRVLPGANQTYSFTINQNVGGVAYVDVDGSGGPLVVVLYNTRTELTGLGLAECVTNPLNKAVNGSVAGLGAGQRADVYLGLGTTSVPANGPFSITNVDDGPTDLFAARSVLDLGTFSQTPDRFILRRNLNPANNSTLPLLDFGAAEAFAPATATYTIANAGSDILTLTTGFSTSRGISGFFTFGPLTGGGAARTVYGVPLARTEAGDLHQVFVNAVAGTTSIRSAAQYNRELVNRTITLGAELMMPTISTITNSPYARLRAVGTFQADYPDAVGASFTQSAGAGRSWAVNASRGYLNNAAAYELALPDLSGAAGFNAVAWGSPPVSTRSGHSPPPACRAPAAHRAIRRSRTTSSARRAARAPSRRSRTRGEASGQPTARLARGTTPTSRAFLRKLGPWSSTTAGLVLPLMHHLVQQRVHSLSPAVAPQVLAAEHDLGAGPVLTGGAVVAEPRLHAPGEAHRDARERAAEVLRIEIGVRIGETREQRRIAGAHHLFATLRRRPLHLVRENHVARLEASRARARRGEGDHGAQHRLRRARVPLVNAQRAPRQRDHHAARAHERDRVHGVQAEAVQAAQQHGPLRAPCRGAARGAGGLVGAGLPPSVRDVSRGFVPPVRGAARVPAGAIPDGAAAGCGDGIGTGDGAAGAKKSKPSCAASCAATCPRAASRFTRPHQIEHGERSQAARVGASVGASVGVYASGVSRNGARRPRRR